MVAAYAGEGHSFAPDAVFHNGKGSAFLACFDICRKIVAVFINYAAGNDLAGGYCVFQRCKVRVIAADDKGSGGFCTQKHFKLCL